MRSISLQSNNERGPCHRAPCSSAFACLVPGTWHEVPVSVVIGVYYYSKFLRTSTVVVVFSHARVRVRVKRGARASSRRSHV